MITRLWTLTSLLMAPLTALHAVGAPPTKPNIVFIFADDWGWGDLSCHGHPWLKTPNLDRLASAGTDFQQFNMLNLVCSPSRTAATTIVVRAGDPTTTLWFEQPATKFYQSLVLGNGRIGAMVFGGVDEKRIVLNESSVRSGSSADVLIPGGCKALPEIRRLLIEERFGATAIVALQKAINEIRERIWGIQEESLFERGDRGRRRDGCRTGRAVQRWGRVVIQGDWGYAPYGERDMVCLGRRKRHDGVPF